MNAVTRARRAASTHDETVGKALITVAVVSTAVIQPMADFNRSHAFNEDWPPHAHFHDLAAIGMLEICCATSMYLLRTRRGDRRLNTAVAAILPAAFLGTVLPRPLRHRIEPGRHHRTPPGTQSAAGRSVHHLPQRHRSGGRAHPARYWLVAVPQEPQRRLIRTRWPHRARAQGSEAGRIPATSRPAYRLLPARSRQRTNRPDDLTAEPIAHGGPAGCELGGPASTPPSSAAFFSRAA